MFYLLISVKSTPKKLPTWCMNLAVQTCLQPDVWGTGILGQQKQGAQLERDKKKMGKQKGTGSRRAETGWSCAFDK